MSDSVQKMALTGLDLVVIAVYFASLFLLGVWMSRRQTSEEVYFLGGRKMPWFLAGVSIIAGMLSTLTFLSTPGEFIGHGVGYFSELFSYFLVIPVVNGIIIPFLMRLPVSSVYDYLERRYGPSVRTLGAAIFVLMRLFWMGLIFYTVSFAVNSMTGWPVEWIITVVGIITVFYTSLGGLGAVIWSDFAQFVLLFGGALFIPCYVWYSTATGPLGWWETFSAAGRADVPVFSFDFTVRVTLVGMLLEGFLWNICTHSSDQIAVQRYLSTPSAAAAKRSVWVFSLCAIAMTGLLMVGGLALFYFYFHESGLPLADYQRTVAGSQGDKLMMRFIVQRLPSGVAGAMLAAIMASAMSCLSAGMNSVSTVVTTDFFERFLWRGRRPEGLNLAKLVAAMAGVACMGLGLLVAELMRAVDWNLVEMIQRINHLFVAPIGALFFSGIIFRRVGAAAAWLGFLCGVATAVVVSFSRQIFDMEHGIAFAWIMPAAFVVSLGVSFLTGFLFRRPTEAQLASMYRGSR